jgi:hypothetical protein
MIGIGDLDQIGGISGVDLFAQLAANKLHPPVIIARAV